MKDKTEEELQFEKRPPNYVFDGFCHRPYQENLDGWRMEQLEECEVPSVQMAKDILSLFSEVNSLRQENWRLQRRLESYDKYGF